MNSDGKKITIVFMATPNLLFVLAEMLVNLQKTNGDLYDHIIVYHSGFTENDLMKLQLIEPRILFKRYTQEDWEKEHKVPETKQALNAINKYSHMNYSKYKIFELLENYSNILYLDLDMLIKGDLSDLLELHGIAWRDAADPFGTKFDKHTPMDPHLDWLANIPYNHSVPNGGLIYISRDNLDWKRCLELGREFTVRFMDYFSAALDELAFSWIAYKQCIPIVHLDLKIYNTILSFYSFDTKIVHFMIRNKPWNNEISQTIFSEWIENYKIADQIAHFENDNVVIHEKPYVKELLCEESWKAFFAETSFKIPSELYMVNNFNTVSLVMKYKDDVFYEFVLGLFIKQYHVGLWIKDKEMIQNELLRQRINALKKDFLVKENEKGLYIYSRKKGAAKNVVDDFDQLYCNTIGIIKALRINKNVMQLNSFLSRKQKHEVFLSDKVNVYFSYLSGTKGMYTLIISAKDECSRYWNEFIDLSELPLMIAPQPKSAYVAVLQGERTIFERSDENQIYISLSSLVDGLFVTVFSEGCRNGRRGKEKNEIRINNIDYSMHGRGLNFVVINNDLKKVIDSFYIDTWKDNKFEIKRNQDRVDYINILEMDMFSDPQESM